MRAAATTASAAAARAADGGRRAAAALAGRTRTTPLVGAVLASFDALISFDASRRNGASAVRTPQSPCGFDDGWTSASNGTPPSRDQSSICRSSRRRWIDTPTPSDSRSASSISLRSAPVIGVARKASAYAPSSIERSSAATSSFERCSSERFAVADLGS